MLMKLYNFFSSMKTGLILLGLIGLTSALGSGLWPDIFSRTTFFKVLILLLFINMALCSGSQVKKFIKKLNKSRGQNRPLVRPTGILLLHIGILIILLGGALNSIYGQSAQMTIVEGKPGLVSDWIKTDKILAIKLDKFKIEYNNDGSPSQYYSRIRVLEQGKQSSYTISVNHPLKYGKVKAYQESFGYLIKAESEYGTDKTKRILAEGNGLTFPGTQRTVKVYKYIPNFDPRYGMNSKTLRPDNPRVIFSVYEKGKLLGIGAARFGEEVAIDKGVTVRFNGTQMFSVLKIKTDPGLPVTIAGGLMLMIGVCLSLFVTPIGLQKSTVLSDMRNEAATAATV